LSFQIQKTENQESQDTLN